MISCPCCATKIEGVALPDQLHKLRDGEVVLYKRPESARWQARFKLPDGEWHSISTKRTALDEAKRIAADAYDEAKYRFKRGESPVSRRFRDVAKRTLHFLRWRLRFGTFGRRDPIWPYGRSRMRPAASSANTS